MQRYDFYRFEECVGEVFKTSGYSVDREVPIQHGKIRVDLVAVKENVQYYVEVKCSSKIEMAIQQVNLMAEMDNAVPVVVTAYKVDEVKRQNYSKLYPKVEIVDICNLLYAVQYNIEIQNSLIASLPYAIDDVEPKPGLLQSDILMHADYTETLIGELQACSPGDEMASQYEDICHRLLENIFSEDLALWRTQQKSNKDLYRFDLLCRIKDGNQKSFWSIVERFFNSKYIVFEFKNYSSKVTQKEIYTTEKYLYAKALRSVGVIIAANGFDENSRWAAKGCLRENGKLILLLDSKDLVRMSRMKMEQDDPSDYLLAKLDDLLLELEK